MNDRTLDLKCVIIDLKQQVRDTGKERDELLDALQRLSGAIDVTAYGAALAKARAAIARATGEQP